MIMKYLLCLLMSHIFHQLFMFSLLLGLINDNLLHELFSEVEIE